MQGLPERYDEKAATIRESIVELGGNLAGTPAALTVFGCKAVVLAK